MRSREIEDYKKGLKLSETQREILVGVLLGDAHLETRNGRTYRVKIEQSEKHKGYVEHLFKVFEVWARTPPQEKVTKRGNSICRKFWFQTLSHSSFRFYAQQFYQGKRKRVPKLLHKWLSARGLAYWYMDDGSFNSKESKAVILNTHAFDEREVAQLCKLLQALFSLDSRPRKQKDGIQIFISGRSYERFKDLVQPYLLEEFQYKLPKARITKLPKE